MNRTHKIQTGGIGLISALMVSVFGGLTTGCVPTDDPTLAQYNAANYQPNTDSSGLAGTWILTLGATEPTSQGTLNEYGRELVRIKPIDEAAGTYDLTYCSSGPFVRHETITAKGNRIALPDLGYTPFINFSKTGNGTAKAITRFNSIEGGAAMHYAIRISGNPDLAIGTVGVDFASDNASMLTEPAVCFRESRTIFEKPGIFPNGHQILASGNGENNPVRIWASLDDDGGFIEALQGDNVNNASFPLYGPVNGDITQSTAHGVTGTLVTDGYDPSTAGSAVFDLKLP